MDEIVKLLKAWWRKLWRRKGAPLASSKPVLVARGVAHRERP